MIHAVMVSVKYADFLAHTLPQIKRFVDNVTVITSWEDQETYEVARVHCASVCRTDVFKEGFCKGAAINEALRLLLELGRDQWLLHLDADIGVLDPINVDALDKSTLYGAERYSVRGQQGWRAAMRDKDYWKELKPCPQDGPFVKPTYRKRRRIIHRRLLPPGFFQLWHSSAFHDYPQESLDASLDDIFHAQRFKNTAVLPDFGVYHLETLDHDLKANWQGRSTRRF